MRTLNVTNSDGVPFTVIHIPAGQEGPNPHRVNVRYDVVEFHDARYKRDGAHTAPQFTEHGQFVSYYRLQDLPHAGGLNLSGGVPSWFIDAKAMDLVNNWLANAADEEKP